MKYLAAYALLALSGKKDISTSRSTQTPRTSRDFSAASNPTPLMQKSMRSSTLSEARPSTSSSLKDRADSATPPLPLPLRPPIRRMPRRKRRRKSLRRRRKNPRKRSRKLPKNNKTPT